MTRATPRALLAWAILSTGACSPAAERKTQVVFFVDTDAPIDDNQTASARSPATIVHGHFDRVELAVYPPDAAAPCEGCVRVFSPQPSQFRDARVSIGIPVTPGRSGYRVRVRLYRADLADGEPRAASTIETVVALAPVDAGAVVESHVVLETERIGVPVGTLAAPAAARPGRPGVSRVGTWPGAVRTPCKHAPREGEVCVPGGAFFRGHPSASRPDAPTDPRLVVLSPYFLETTETRTGAVRGRALDSMIRGWISEALRQRETVVPEDTKQELREFCTLRMATSAASDELPLNCVGVFDAEAYCAERGKMLPSDAQLAYVAGAFVGNRFPWGRELPTCEDSVFGRRRSASPACLDRGWPAGPAPVATSTRDLVDVGGVQVHDLAGNLGEWVRDGYIGLDRACAERTGVLVDPVCHDPVVADNLDDRTAFGGSWYAGASESGTWWRAALGNSAYPGVGFRCARPDTE